MCEIMLQQLGEKNVKNYLLNDILHLKEKYLVAKNLCFCENEFLK